MKKEATIKDFVVILLERANLIILIAIIAALIMSAWAASSLFSRTDSVEKQEDTEAISTMEHELSILNKSLEQQTDYVNKSIYFQLDGNKVGTRVVYLLVGADQSTVVPELNIPKSSSEASEGFNLQFSNPTYDIASAYCTTFKNDEVYNGIKSIVGKDIAPTYIFELVQMVQLNNNGLIQLTAFYDDIETAERIAQLVLDDMIPRIRDAVAEHDIKIIADSSYYGINAPLLNLQTETLQKINVLREDIKKKEATLKASETSSDVSISAQLKKVILFAIVGLFAGFFLASLFFIFISFFENKVTSKRVLERNYSIPVIGVIGRDKLER